MYWFSCLPVINLCYHLIILLFVWPLPPGPLDFFTASTVVASATRLKHQDQQRRRLTGGDRSPGHSRRWSEGRSSGLLAGAVSYVTAPRRGGKSAESEQAAAHRTRADRQYERNDDNSVISFLGQPLVWAADYRQAHLPQNQRERRPSGNHRSKNMLTQRRRHGHSGAGKRRSDAAAFTSSHNNHRHYVEQLYQQGPPQQQHVHQHHHHPQHRYRLLQLDRPVHLPVVSLETSATIVDHQYDDHENYNPQKQSSDSSVHSHWDDPLLESGSSVPTFTSQQQTAAAAPRALHPPDSPLSGQMQTFGAAILLRQAHDQLINFERLMRPSLLLLLWNYACGRQAPPGEPRQETAAATAGPTSRTTSTEASTEQSDDADSAASANLTSTTLMPPSPSAVPAAEQQLSPRLPADRTEMSDYGYFVATTALSVLEHYNTAAAAANSTAAASAVPATKQRRISTDRQLVAAFRTLVSDWKQNRLRNRVSARQITHQVSRSHVRRSRYDECRTHRSDE